MLMAEALTRHVGSRRRHDVVRWFFDAPGEGYVYSIHNMVRCGTRYDMMPGEWYGPGVAAHVLRDLCEMHDHEGGLGMAMTVTSPERPLCVDDVLDAMTTDSATVDVADDDTEETTTPEEGQNYDPLLCPPPAARRAAARAQKRLEARERRLAGEWRRSLLVVVPLRLGLHKLEDKYVTPLLQCLGLPQSVGFVGGRPRQALYFVGAHEKHFLGLDPHIVQPCGTLEDVLSPTHLDSLVCVAPRKVPVDSIDPSLALGFYCRRRADFLDLTTRMKQTIAPLSSPPLFDILDKRPVTASNRSDDAFLDDSFLTPLAKSSDLLALSSIDSDDLHTQDDDDDDYVVV